MLRSPNRLHEKASFFKYMSSSTAGIVLNTGTLRWSSPLLFNDPFDVPRELSFGVTAQQIGEAVTKTFINLLENPPEETSGLHPSLRFIVDAVKLEKSPDLRREIISEIGRTSGDIFTTETKMDALRNLWRSWLPDFRMLCFAESPAHSAMWLHYADRYKGAVLEFACNDELDSAWLRAEPVIYSENNPEVYEADGWGKIFTMSTELAIRAIFNGATRAKSSDWSYENEWRIISHKRENDGGHFTDYQFDPRELVGIYLGPRMSDEDRALLGGLKTKYPNVRICRVEIGMSRALLFKE